MQRKQSSETMQRKQPDPIRNPIEFFGGVNLILNPIEAGEYNEYLDKIKKYCEKLGKDVSTHQLRSIFSKVRGAKELDDVYPLRYKIAYLAGRNKKNKKLVSLCNMLDELIKNVKTKDELKRFQEFFEAIIAYQKYVTGE
jgi:CRISPR-associated protein Csm2